MEYMPIDREEFSAMWLRGDGAAEIAAHFGCHINTVNNRVKRFGLPARPLGFSAGRRATPVSEAKLRELYAAGLSHDAIAKAMGIGLTPVRKRIKALGLVRFTAPEPVSAPEPEPVTKPHLAAVRMPDSPLAQRQDYPDFCAAITRAKGSTVALGQVAARFRLPYSVVRGHAQRLEAQG